jgi:hypothetical protein
MPAIIDAAALAGCAAPGGLLQTRVAVCPPAGPRDPHLPAFLPIPTCLHAYACPPAHRDEWVRAMAQSVDGYDGRLHTDRLLAGSKLVGRTVAGMAPLLDSADPRLFRPLEVGRREGVARVLACVGNGRGNTTVAASVAACSCRWACKLAGRPASNAPGLF